MKAILNPDGTFRELVESDKSTAPDRTRTWVPTEKPVPGADEVVEEAAPEITDSTVTQRWQVRAKTDAEAQKVTTQLSLWQRLSDSERRALRSLANTEGPAGDAALLVEGAMFSAVETESRNPQTKALLGAAIQLHVVASVDRAREILEDPGFNLE